MPSNANVIIEYGPYNSNGIVEYRLERIQGLQSKMRHSTKVYHCQNIISILNNGQYNF